MEASTFMIITGVVLGVWWMASKLFGGLSDTSEDKSEEDEEVSEDEAEYENCELCKKKVEEDQDGDINTYECDECSTTCCDDCCFEFENAGIILCKNCINKEYPREEKVVEKIVEKIIEIPSADTDTRVRKKIQSIL